MRIVLLVLERLLAEWKSTRFSTDTSKLAPSGHPSSDFSLRATFFNRSGEAVHTFIHTFAQLLT